MISEREEFNFATSNAERLVVSQELADIFRWLLLDDNQSMRVIADQTSTRRQPGVGTTVDVYRCLCLSHSRAHFACYFPWQTFDLHFDFLFLVLTVGALEVVVSRTGYFMQVMQIKSEHGDRGSAQKLMVRPRKPFHFPHTARRQKPQLVSEEHQGWGKIGTT